MKQTKAQRAILKYLKKNHPEKYQKYYDESNSMYSKTIHPIIHILNTDSIFSSLVISLTTFLSVSECILSTRLLYIQYQVQQPIICDECGDNIVIRSRVELVAYKEQGYRFCNMSCSMKSTKTRIKRESTLIERTGFRHQAFDPVSKEKRKKTVNEKYGVDHYLQSEDFKGKYETTCMNRFGFSNPSGSPEVRRKRRNTHKFNTGYEEPFANPTVRSKCERTLLRTFGVSHPTQSELIQQKTRDTLMSRYGVTNISNINGNREKCEATTFSRLGVTHHSQDSEIFSNMQKNSFYRKEVTVRKKKFLLQGYEPQALDYMMYTKNLSEIDILSNSEFEYHFPYVINGKNHAYHPDFFIPKDNRIVEVKSIWTLCRNKEKWNEFQKKRESVLSTGSLFSLILIHKRERICIPEKLLSGTFHSINKFISSYIKTKKSTAIRN